MILGSALGSQLEGLHGLLKPALIFLCGFKTNLDATRYVAKHTVQFPCAALQRTQRRLGSVLHAACDCVHNSKTYATPLH